MFSTGTASATLYPGAILLTSSNAGAQTRGSASGEVTVTDLLFEKLPGFEGNPDTFSAALEVSQSTTAPSGDMSANLSVRNTDTGTGGGSDSTTTPGQTLIVSISNLEVGELYTVEFGGSVRTVTGGPDDVSLTLQLNAASVLDLPEGYTANSIDGMMWTTCIGARCPSLRSWRLWASANWCSCAVVRPPESRPGTTSQRLAWR